MKHKLTFIYLAVAGVLLLGSCKKDDDRGGATVKWYDHAILYYEKPDVMFVTLLDKSGMEITGTPAEPYMASRLVVGVGGRNRFFGDGVQYSKDVKNGVFTSLDESPERFDSLTAAHGDFIKTKMAVPVPPNYNKYQRYIPSLYRQLESIDIVADRDYDAAHPAGTPLNDIAEITFYSIEEIAMGDTGVERLDLTGYDFEHKENLTDFNAKKRKFMGFDFKIGLLSAPASSDTFRFTVTYENEDGDVLSQTTGPINISAN